MNESSKDQVSIYIDPLLTKAEQEYLSKKSCYGSRKNVISFVNNMITPLILMKSKTRFNHVEFYILLRLNSKPFLSKKQKGFINQMIKSFNARCNNGVNKEKVTLKKAIDENVNLILNKLNKSQSKKSIKKVAEKSNSILKLDESFYEATPKSVKDKRNHLIKSARKRDLDFNLSDKEIELLIKRKTCYYTGARFSSSNNYSKTFDRIDSTKGYISGNVVVCTNGANQMKNILIENGIAGDFKLTLNQFKKMASKL